MFNFCISCRINSRNSSGSKTSTWLPYCITQRLMASNPLTFILNINSPFPNSAMFWFRSSFSLVIRWAKKEDVLEGRWADLPYLRIGTISATIMNSVKPFAPSLHLHGAINIHKMPPNGLHSRRGGFAKPHRYYATKSGKSPSFREAIAPSACSRG